jgi:acyl carrier protein
MMEEKIKEFVSSRLGIPIEEITMESKMESDFGVAGLDTISFYEEFFRKFEIRNPEDFNIDRYVATENIEIVLMIKSIFSQNSGQNLRIKEVSIEHLIKVAETKFWIEE